MAASHLEISYADFYLTNVHIRQNSTLSAENSCDALRSNRVPVGLDLILAAIRAELLDQLIMYAQKQKGRRPLTYKESVLLAIQHLKR